jgi:hypothetical protein
LHPCRDLTQRRKDAKTQRGKPQPNFHHEGHEEHEVLNKPFWSILLRDLREGMSFVDGAFWNTQSAVAGRTETVTIRACWPLTSRWITGDAREEHLEFNLRFRE